MKQNNINNNVNSKNKHFIAPFTLRNNDFLPVQGKGSYLFNEQNQKKLDYLCGIGVLLLGHCHPLLVKTLSVQLKKQWCVSNLYYTKPLIDCAKTLCNLTFATNCFFVNSGTEANELAIKIARKYHIQKGINKLEFISFNNGFHGRTIGAMSVSNGSEKTQLEFGPMVPHCKIAAFNNINSVKKLISPTTAAIIIEPVQGKFGPKIADNNFLKQLRQICDENDIILIFDEVQSGCGRTGHLFYYQHANVEPDILCAGKGLGGGLPIGAVLFGKKVQIAVQPNVHGSTFANNPMVTSVANKVLNIISNVQFLQNVVDMGEFFKHKLQKISAQYPSVFSEVEGIGLTIGLKTKKEILPLLVSKILQNGAICMQGNGMIRLFPPLNTNLKEINLFISILEKSVKTLLV
ncbi:MAG: acetylornithine transaminase [Alphaproteobacteria bacterium]|nr:acetylornithine transaminase [Rickettsiales bacterium]